MHPRLNNTYYTYMKFNKEIITLKVKRTQIYLFLHKFGSIYILPAIGYGCLIDAPSSVGNFNHLLTTQLFFTNSHIGDNLPIDGKYTKTPFRSILYPVSHVLFPRKVIHNDFFRNNGVTTLMLI